MSRQYQEWVASFLIPVLGRGQPCYFTLFLGSMDDNYVSHPTRLQIDCGFMESELGVPASNLEWVIGDMSYLFVSDSSVGAGCA